MLRKILVSILFFLIWGISIAHSKEHFFIKYFYYLSESDEPAGMILMENKGNSLFSEYFQINPKLPFYAPKKILEITSEGALKTAIVEYKNKKRKYEIIYGLDKISDKRMLKILGLPSRELPNTILIVNKKEQFFTTIPKKKVFTIDSLLLYFLVKKSIPKGEFYIFEPYKKVLVRAKAEKIENNVAIYGMTRNGKVRLFEIVVNNQLVPIKIISGRKKWFLVLKGLGDIEMKKIPFTNLIVSKIGEEIREKQTYPVEVHFKNYQAKGNDYIYQFEGMINLTNLSSEKLSEFVKNNFLPNEVSFYLKNLQVFEKKGVFYLFVPKSALCPIFQETNPYLTDNCEKQKITIQEAIMSLSPYCEVKKKFLRKQLVCQGGKPEVYILKYLISHNIIPKNSKIEKLDYSIEEQESPYDFEQKEYYIQVKVEYSLPFNLSKEAKTWLSTYFANKQIEETQEGFVIKLVNNHKVYKEYCNKIQTKLSQVLPDVSVNYTSGNCKVQINYPIKKSNLREIVKAELLNKYPDLEWLKKIRPKWFKGVKWFDDRVEFSYIKEFK
jgi:hypothetical protein